MPKEQKDIQLRSEEVQEILSIIPSWMVRWGNTLIFILILGLFLITWFVKYPDTIAAEIIITTEIPPEKIYAKSMGQIDAILVSDNDKVPENKILSIIENSADYQDVLILKNIIDTLSVDYHNFYFPFDKIPLLFLGDIEPDYAAFERYYSDHKLKNELNPFSNDMMANQVSLTETKSRLNILISQQELNKKELELKNKDLERYKLLYEKGIISSQEYDYKKLEFLQAERAYKTLSSSISQLKETIKNAQRNLRGTEIKKTQEDTKALKNVIQSYNQLKRSLKNWELKYILKSSIPGKVSFLSFWNENQTVNQGDLVFTIIPTGNNSFIGKIKAPMRNSGKIIEGQKVNIRLENYPYTEFGMMEGIIKSISLIPDKEGSYLIDVELPDKLITTYLKEIDFKQEMRGTAEIITEDLRLMERFIYHLRSIFSK